MWPVEASILSAADACVSGEHGRTTTPHRREPPGPEPTVPTEFGDRGFTFRRLRGSEPSFAAVVQDYLDAKRALTFWADSEASGASERVADYTELVAELGAEIRARLTASTRDPP